MLTFEKILEPQYFKDFHCIASACQDNCCTGWNIVVDKDTYDNYNQCQNISLKSMFDRHIVPNADNNTLSRNSHAQIIMQDNVCPFFTKNGLCTVQKTLNEESLPITCYTYPRSFNNVDGVLERSLYLSCPVSSRLVLLNEKPMQFNSIKSIVTLRNNEIPTLNTNDTTDVLNMKPYYYFQDIRVFIISLLQNRTYPLWQRLVILNVFCDRLDRIEEKDYDEVIPNLITNFKDKIKHGDFRKAMNRAGSRSETQFQIMKILIEHRLQNDYICESFLSCVNEFKKGIGGDHVSQETAAFLYAEAYTTHYQPFMKSHEYILENYLVNCVFKNLFPFGPQKSLYIEQKSIYTEFILLVFRFSLIKTLLIGMAGYHRENFNTIHVVDLIQAFAKAVEHNLHYLKQVVQFIEVVNMNNTSGMTILIKN